MKNSICEYVNAHHTDILSTFNELHSMPEPALREVRTADYLKTQLKQAGFDVRGGFCEDGSAGYPRYRNRRTGHRHKGGYGCALL